jgi:hypothetical protein
MTTGDGQPVSDTHPGLAVPGPNVPAPGRGEERRNRGG